MFLISFGFTLVQVSHPLYCRGTELSAQFYLVQEILDLFADLQFKLGALHFKDFAMHRVQVCFRYSAVFGAALLWN